MRSCVEAECPLDCGPGTWRPWGPCSVTCGPGVRARTRNSAGERCSEVTEEEECEMPECEEEGTTTTGYGGESTVHLLLLPTSH